MRFNLVKHIFIDIFCLAKNAVMEGLIIALIATNQISIANYNLQPAFAKQNIMTMDLLSVVNAIIHGSNISLI